jgi:hypothetical protein
MRRNGRARLLLAAAVMSILPSAVTCIHAEDPESWGRYPDSIEDVLRRFPPREANRTALEIERISAEIGIDLAPYRSEGRPHPEQSAADSYKKAKDAIETYLSDQLKRPDSVVKPPPPAALDFLKLRQPALEALRECLAHGDPPGWERHLDKLGRYPIFNALGHIELQKVLVADAMSRESSGDEKGALDDLEASWTLNSAVRDEPYEYTQLNAIAVIRFQAGALRKLPAAPAVWSDRLREHDYWESLLTALQIQGWILTQRKAPPWFDTTKRLASKAVAFAGGPYYRACMRNIAELWSHYLVRLAGSRSLCDADRSSLDKELMEAIPWWNRLGPNLVWGGSWAATKVTMLDVDLELTSQILELRAARRRTGAWPSSLASAGESTACPGSHWVHERTATGERSIALDRKLTWPNQMGLILPTSFVTGGITRPSQARGAAADRTPTPGQAPREPSRTP